MVYFEVIYRNADTNKTEIEKVVEKSKATSIARKVSKTLPDNLVKVYRCEDNDKLINETYICTYTNGKKVKP